MSAPNPYSPAERIRSHLRGVESLRSTAASSGMLSSVQTIKRLQAVRFEHTYTDFLADGEYAAAARFFLDELYGVRDFSQRDQQFGRIAGGLERLFPPSVAELAVDLVELHALTEQLDHAMAIVWNDLSADLSWGERYVAAWQAAGSRQERDRQLAVVSAMGAELEHLTRKKSLRTALRLMRGPAKAAGLDALQRFLEAGFDAFASMVRPRILMEAIQLRETLWMDRLFASGDADCSSDLNKIWDSHRQ